MSRYDDIVERLRAIEEELRDRAFEQLTAAATHHDPDGDAGNAAQREEKRLLAARRAIAKAIAALDEREGSSEDL